MGTLLRPHLVGVTKELRSSAILSWGRTLVPADKALGRHSHVMDLMSQEVTLQVACQLCALGLIAETWAQVHAVMPSESGAMMLLVGHRRLKRLRTVRACNTP